MFVADRKKITPADLDFTDLDAPTIAAFLTYLETERHNSIRSRNARLAAIHSMFRFAALEHPEHAEVIARVLAIPQKRFERAIVSFPHQRMRFRHCWPSPTATPGSDAETTHC